jgi:protein TonB
MFESATFESSNVLPSQVSKWLLFGLAVNLLVVAAVIAVPLIYPDVLQSQLLPQMLTVPAAQGHAAEHRTQTAATTGQRAPMTVPIHLDLNSRITPTGHEAKEGVEEKGPEGSIDAMMGGDEGDIGGPTVFRGSTPPVTVKPAPPRAVTLSGGVTDGMVIWKTTPVYPPIAKITGTTGTVVLAATISAGGTIENLRVISGNQMLREAAIEAVKTWRYRPYLLNRQPVEVETTINVVFSMSGR